MKSIVIALVLTFLIAGTSQLVFEYSLPGFLVVAVYLLLYWLVQRMRPSREAAVFPNDAPPDRSAWPISGPLSRLGPTAGGVLFMISFWMTNLLSLLNPFQLAQIIRQLIGNERLKAREKRTGSNGTEYQTKASYCLPFQGEWLVFNGGRTPRTSHSWDILGQRFAWDFVQADDRFRRHKGAGARLEEYHCYGQPIHAAADGTVAGVENRISDAPFIGFGVCDFTARHFFGNHVIIQHAEGEYAVYAHLIRGSISVQPGEVVGRGQPIGRCGHSGHSSEPHLHFHLQDSPDLFSGMGLPISFSHVVIDQQQTKLNNVTAGQRVRNSFDTIDRMAACPLPGNTQAEKQGG